MIYEINAFNVFHLLLQQTNLSSLIAVDIENMSWKLSVQIQLHKTFHPSVWKGTIELSGTVQLAATRLKLAEHCKKSQSIIWGSMEQA